MAFEDVTERFRYLKYAECSKGDLLAEGHFVRSEMDKTYFKPKYFITGEDGIITVLNASGQLDKVMQKLKPGDFVRVIFEGSSVMDHGRFKGKSAYSFKVQVDPERRREELVEPLAVDF